MDRECYRPDEILHLEGNEPHLSLCPTCRSRYDRGRAFVGAAVRAAGPASAAGAGWKAAQASRAQLAAIAPGSVPAPEARPAGRAAPTPEMVLDCCERSRQDLLCSPNRAERWLEAAAGVLSAVTESENPWRERDRQWAAARLEAARGNLLAARGRIGEAHTVLTAARNRFEALGDEFQTLLAARSLSFTLAKKGRLLEARDLCLEAAYALAGYGAAAEVRYLLNNLALIRLALSEPRKAAALFHHLLRRLEPHDPFQPTIRRNAILPLMEAGRWGGALGDARRLARELEAGDLGVERARTHRLIGEILLVSGEPSAAQVTLRRAARDFENLGAGYETAQTEALLGQACLATGDHREAEGRFRRALQFYMEEGFAVDLIHLLEAWSREAGEGGAGEREFAAFRQYWRFAPASAPVC
jgi:tetratricopeptide (TPR) repeat protein